MTFMMEPPKFIEVDYQDKSENLGLYRLYMYSEFNFPSENDLAHDLKDSFPVLFIPGNAGSYQQVRSLASTCIRRQLQSIDALKFVFYTIDFGGQLSGLSGQLIEDQTRFVSRALRRIEAVHASNFNGIILVGHSVGGFISKLLFTMENFDAKSVPLLISLASPLVGPHLAFDSKMRLLYEEATRSWSHRNSSFPDTYAISISGGKSDRLVPTHLSQDPHFDLSITTRSIKDVWISMDHVSITWCRELMFKLAHLLSALMNKKETRLLSDKTLVTTVAKDELLTFDRLDSEMALQIKSNDWATSRSNVITPLNGSLYLSRFDLLDSIQILDIRDTRDDILIVVEHLYKLHENDVFGCQDLIGSGQVKCSGKITLKHLSRPMPSIAYEPRRTIFRLNRSINIRYIVFDLGRKPESNSKAIGPESVTITETNFDYKARISIPSIFEFLFNTLSLKESSSQDILPSHESSPLSLIRLELENLVHQTQFFEMKLSTHSCPKKVNPSLGAALFYHDGVMVEAFSPEEVRDGTSKIIIRLYKPWNLNSTLSDRKISNHLELYIDSSCKNDIKVTIDVHNLLLYVINTKLSQIIQYAVYFIVYRTINTIDTSRLISNVRLSTFFEPLGLLGIYFLNKVMRQSQISDMDTLDRFLIFILVYILSNGLAAFLVFFMNRIVEMALIINRVQTSLIEERNTIRQVSGKYNVSDEGNGVSHQVKSGSKLINIDIEWLVFISVVSLSAMFSCALISLFSLMLIISLCLSSEYRRKTLTIDARLEERKRTKSVTNCDMIKEMQISETLSSLGALFIATIITNIPATLIRINQMKLGSRFSLIKLASFDNISLLLLAIISAILIKIMRGDIDKFSKTKQLSRPLLAPIFCKSIELLSFLPLVLVDSNTCYINHATLITLIALTLKFRSRRM